MSAAFVCSQIWLAASVLTDGAVKWTCIAIAIAWFVYYVVGHAVWGRSR